MSVDTNTPARDPNEFSVMGSSLESAAHTVVQPSHLIAIGASAGGLDALEKLIAGLAIDTGAAFVIIQHLSPDYKSLMDTLLARYTNMPVVVVHDNMPLLANRVHLIPPGSLMLIEGNRLRLRPKSPRINTLPVDVFFQSTALEWGNRSVGIILSGTGSDGSRGLLAINEAGGLTIVQDPLEAAFDGMPRSAISTGLVDEVLSVDTIPSRVMAHLFRGNELQIITTPQTVLPSSAVTMLHVSNTEDGALAAVLQILLQFCGIDFREYKSATVLRRIERRMVVKQVSTIHAF